MNELIEKVLQWGRDKGIAGTNGKGTRVGQAKKMMEEATEAAIAVAAYNEYGRNGQFEVGFRKERMAELEADIVDSLGDTFVTLILLAEMHGLYLEDCLQSAYDVISKRTGKMGNGVFVKDAS